MRGAISSKLKRQSKLVREQFTIPLVLRKRPNKEAVHHPSHYGGDVPHEVVKCLEAWGLENDALLWNAVKYIARAGKKGNKIEDLEKAQWYLTRRIDSLRKGKV